MKPDRHLQLSDTAQRLIAVALLVLPLALLYFLLVAPYLRVLADNRERIEDLRFQLQRLQRTAAKAPAWARQLKTLQANPAIQRHYLQGATPALASAELQDRLRQAVQTAGAELISTQVLRQTKEDGFTKIPVRARFTASSRQLQEILQEIEGNPPYLIVERMTIRSLRGRRDPKTHKFLPIDKLNVDLTVYGYLQPEPDS